MGFIEGFKQGLTSTRSGRYRIRGHAVTCPVCGGKTFDDGTAQLHTAGATLLGVEWLGKNASLLICRECTHILWFAETPEEL